MGKNRLSVREAILRMEKTASQLLELVKSALWNYDVGKDRLGDCDLTDLLQEAEKQTIVGLVADGLTNNKQFDNGSKEEKFQWIVMTSQIGTNIEKHQRVLRKTIESLHAGGIPVAFMKGLIVGNRYPNPYRRQCGDIDFIVSGKDYQRTLGVLDEIGKVDYSLVHEHHGMAFVDGVTLEPHYKVHNFQNPKVDDAMREMFLEVFPQSIVYEKVGDIDVPTFPSSFECAVLVGHMVNHVYAEGLGLRQVIDFMMFLDKKYARLDKDKCHLYLNQLHMERAFRIFVRICEKFLGLSEKLLNLSYTSKESAFADKLIEDIMKVGNFGRGENYLGKTNVLRPIRSYLWVVRRCVKLGYLCPAEAWWWPVSKVRRFFGKKQKERLV